MENIKRKTAPVGAMAVVSLILGILSIPLSLVLWGGGAAGLAITLALLSRGRDSMNGVAIAGLVCGIIGGLTGGMAAAVLFMLALVL